MKISIVDEISYIKDGQDIFLEVEFYGDMILENNGIGSYEYWGYRGYDHGQDYYECEGVDWDKPCYTEEENAAIQQYVDEYYDKICGQLIDKAENIS